MGAIVLGTVLNPLNSSMIAVALTRLQLDFHASIAAATALISAFYLAGALGQPLMGRLADLFGPRRVFGAGLALVLVTGAAAPFTPGLGWLVAVRAIQAFGTAAAYPSGLSMIRTATGDPTGRPPAAALGALNLAGNVSAALGPVVGGFLVAFAGWQAIFLVNVPLTLVGLVALFLWLPADGPQRVVGGAMAVLRAVDPIGVVLAGATLLGLLGFLLSLAAQPQWGLLALLPVAGAGLVWHERRRAEPFIDVRMIAGNPRLMSVFAQFAGTTGAFYTIFFGLPLWFQQSRGFSPDRAGLLLLPIAGLGALVTPIAARLILRRGPQPALILGSCLLLTGSLLILLLGPTTPVSGLVLVAAVLGLPNGFNTLGLQASLYEATPPERTGAAGGLFQTFRYVGAIFSASLIALVFDGRVSTGGLHVLAVAIAGVSVLLVVASVTGGATRTRR